MPDRTARASGWILVLDVGSSSVRAWLYDRWGRGLDPGPEAQSFYAWRTDPPGTMECEAGMLFERLAEVVDAALAHARAAGMRIEAVATAAFWHSLLGLDGADDPVTPVYAWGDVRAADEALHLRSRADADALHQRTGCFLHPSYPSVKLRWLAAQHRTAFSRVASWVSFPEYVETRLFGERRCSFSMASGSGLLDVHRLRWDAEALDLSGIRAEQLSPLVDADAPLTGLRPEFARRWPELARVRWFPALGDGACANVGSGALGLDRYAVTVGTSAAARALWIPEGRVELPSGLWGYRLDRRHWVAGGALSNGGNAVAYLREFLSLPEEREWEAELAAMPPDAHGLTILPYLVGERGPEWLRETRSVVFGLRSTTSPEELLRAWMEAIAYRLARICFQLEDVLARSPRVLASGGALHASPVWAQILADVLERPVSLPVEPEATARGAALVAQEQMGWIRSLEAAAPVADAARFEPDAERHARYRAARERQRRLEATLGTWLTSSSPPGLGGRDF